MPVNLPNKDVLSLKEVAQALDRHVSSIWRWALRGVRGHKLLTILIGGRRVVERRELVKFLGALNTSTATEAKQDSDAHQHRIEEALDSEGF